MRRKPLFDPDKVEHAELIETFAGEAIRYDKLRSVLGSSDSMAARYGHGWMVKAAQQPLLRTLFTVLTDDEFKKLAAYLSVKWKSVPSASAFYKRVADGAAAYRCGLDRLVREVDPAEIRWEFVRWTGNSRGLLTRHMEAFNDIVDMAERGMAVARPANILVYRRTTTADGNPVGPDERKFVVDGVSRSKLYGLQFVPWREWLGMEVETASRALYGDAAVVAACVYEMTAVGFNDDVVQRKMRAIRESAEEMRKMYGNRVKKGKKGNCRL